MLIALQTFTDPTDGQPITAGKTRVSEDADVALMFPDRFRADGERSGVTNRFIRVAGRHGDHEPRRLAEHRHGYPLAGLLSGARAHLRGVTGVRGGEDDPQRHSLDAGERRRRRDRRLVTRR